MQRGGISLRKYYSKDHSVDDLLAQSKTYASEGAYIESWQPRNTLLTTKKLYEAIGASVYSTGNDENKTRTLIPNLKLHHGTIEKRDSLQPRNPNWFRKMKTGINSKQTALDASKDGLLSILPTKNSDEEVPKDPAYKFIYRIEPKINPVIFYIIRENIEVVTTAEFSKDEIISIKPKS